MEFLSLMALGIGAALALVTLPGTLELLFLTLGGLLPGRKAPAVQADRPFHLAVIVPAHNEETGIQRTVQSLLQCDPAGQRSVVVVADNCTDATAERASRAGARVLVRHDRERRGKGYALDYAFQQLLPEGIDAFLIVDADTVVAPNLMAEARRYFLAGADAVQCRYQVRNVDASLRTRWMNAALLAYNVLRPRGRDRWGLSSGIYGNGFGLSRETLLAVPYHAVSIVEDLEYHLRLVRAGRAVRFIHSSIVWGDMPTGGRASTTQRARWEGGRLLMAVRLGPRLLGDILTGRWRMLEPLLDLLLLPLAFHIVLLAAAAFTPLAAVRAAALAGLAVVGLHVFAALLKGGGGPRDFLALAAAPAYILWKLAILPIIALTSRRSAEWVRTERANPRKQEPL